MEQSANGFPVETEEKRESDSIKFWIEKVRRNIGLFVFFVIFALCSAFVYNKIAPDIYQVNTTIFLKNNNSKLFELQGLANLARTESQNFIQNESEILKSTRLIKRSLKKLDFQIAYYSSESFRKINIYNDAPFLVVPVDTFKYESSEFIHIKMLNPVQFQLWTKENKSPLLCYFRDTIHYQNYRFKVLLNTSNIEKKEYCFRFRSEQEIFNIFRNIKTTTIASSTVINVSAEGENPKEIAAFLNTLSSEYLIKSVEKKELVSDKTIDFIEMQLKDFSDSLQHSGKKLSGFKSSHQIMDFDQHSEKTFAELSELQKEKVSLLAQQKYFEYLKEYMTDSNNSNKDIVTPVVWGIDNHVLNKLIETLVAEAEEKSELVSIANKQNPLTIANETKIRETKKNIIENVNGLIELNKTSQKNIEESIENLSRNASSLPQTQMELFNHERMFKIYDVLFTYLLTKRCEIQITKAALTPENEVMDIADPEDAILVAPQRIKNYFIALMLGIMIPISILVLVNYLSDKIRNTDEIEELGHPILGQILHCPDKDPIPVLKNPSSILAESFRSVRTHFQFIAEKKSSQVIVVTSTIKDEGKSFVSLNLASSFALSGKKCIMVYFDLRKNLKAAPFGLENNLGLSNVLCGGISVNEAILKTEVENLSVILPGTIPPNPSELISSEYCDEMIEYLKNHFDYIIIDTPPLGMFSDALLLFRYSTANLYLIRYAFTSKTAIRRILNNLKQKNIHKMHIIVNDLPFKQSNYGYSYNYKYNYNAEVKKISLFSSAWKKSKSFWN